MSITFYRVDAEQGRLVRMNGMFDLPVLELDAHGLPLCAGARCPRLQADGTCALIGYPPSRLCEPTLVNLIRERDLITTAAPAPAPEGGCTHRRRALIIDEERAIATCIDCEAEV